MSRPPLERMMFLHRKLQRGEFPNCSTIAAEFEVSAKTIQRDIDFMRYRLGLPVEYHPQRFGFHYTEAVTNFPTIEVSEGELTALFVAQKALGQYQGTPFEKPLRTAFRKISDSLKDHVSFSWADLDEAISFRAIGATPGDLRLFEQISDAVMHSSEIAFEYRKLKSAGYEQRIAQPYHLASVENQWYLFARDCAREQLRTFALPRMRNVEVTKRHFRKPANFSVSQIIGQSFGVFSGRGRYRVRLHFDSFAARLVAERVWHETQRLRFARNGTLTFEIELGSLEEIERWILSWGEHVRVLGPAELVRHVRTAAHAIAKLYD